MTTPRRHYFVVVLSMLALGAGGLWTQPAAAAISPAISAILQRNSVAGPGTGVSVWNLDSAQVISSRGGGQLLVPASNIKLVTTTAALLNWGPRHRFATDLYGPDVPVYGGVLYGNLYLKGYGDPSLSTLDYQRRVLHLSTASFEAFGRRLRKLGVHRVTGRVLGDESWFDKKRTGPSWKAGLQLECARLSALSGNEGLDDGNRVKEPATWAAKLLTRTLEDGGISVAGKPGTGKVPGTARLLKRQYSAPLSSLIKRMNKYSDNYFAETLLKGLGKDFAGKGSTRAGVTVVRATLDALQVPADAYHIVDGSGLSYRDRITPDVVVRLLFTMTRRPEAYVYWDSLAVAGVDGTLKDRMRGTRADGNAHGKTGTLNIAVCLSGYVRSANGRRVGYSILMNGDAVDWGRATKAQDAIVVALAAAKFGGIPLQSLQALQWHHRTSAPGTVDASGGLLKPEL